jgi:hypothetical protein
MSIKVEVVGSDSVLKSVGRQLEALPERTRDQIN